MPRTVKYRNFNQNHHIDHGNSKFLKGQKEIGTEEKFREGRKKYLNSDKTRQRSSYKICILNILCKLANFEYSLAIWWLNSHII